MRAFILVMDSFGIGGAPDADKFGDAGANTFAHIAAACFRGEADCDGVRSGPLRLPNLTRLGLAQAAFSSGGVWPAGFDEAITIKAAYGHARERSFGKDTPSGHWEIAGLPVEFDWAYFPNTVPCFPEDKIRQLIGECELPGILGNKHASGTAILEELGGLHLQTGKPICYTSADSVFQIAAHQQHFGLERLYHICETAKKIFDSMGIGRVIARPFVGERPGEFVRTANRRDYTTPPHDDTLLDRVREKGGEVVSIGKIADIFANRSVSRSVKGKDNMELFDALLREAEGADRGDLVFVNFVDFDMLFGHRRDVIGYAQALEAFDRRLPEFEHQLRPDDLALLTADHGCDPTFPGSDHTREQVPVLFFGPRVKPVNLGQCETFADMGQTVAGCLNLQPMKAGTLLNIR